MGNDLAAVHGAVRDGLGDVADAAGLVLVACSGGPDSLTLAAVTVRTARAHGFGAGAVVVDHGWSAEASAASARAAEQCRELGLEPVELVLVDAGGPGGQGVLGGRGGLGTSGSGGSGDLGSGGGLRTPGSGGSDGLGSDGGFGSVPQEDVGGPVGGVRPPGGPEAVAREARYAALQEAADRLGATAVLLGHTLDDQAETVLLGLGRGSGARSLAGMPARRGVFRRPFLELRREVVARAGVALDLHPWHDPANDDPAYTRVRVRRLAGELEKALGAGTAEALARSAAMLREDADALDALANDLLNRALAAADPTSADPALPPASLVSAPTSPSTSPPTSPRMSPAPTSALVIMEFCPRGHGSASVAVRVEPFRAARPAIRRRALLAAARRAGCPGGALSHRHALALEHLLVTARGQVALPGSVVARVTRASAAGRGARVGLPGRIVAG
jgi:tRNA(Ile)-lysidine synthase